MKDDDPQGPRDKEPADNNYASRYGTREDFIESDIPPPKPNEPPPKMLEYREMTKAEQRQRARRWGRRTRNEPPQSIGSRIMTAIGLVFVIIIFRGLTKSNPPEGHIDGSMGGFIYHVPNLLTALVIVSVIGGIFLAIFRKK